MKRWLSWSATVGAAAAVAACGGDDDKGLSKAEFVKRANAICAQANARGEQLARTAFRNPARPRPEELQAVLREAVTVNRKVISDVRALKPPEADKERVNAMLAAADRSTTAYEQASRTPQASVEMFRRANTPQDPAAEADRLAGQYGLSECAK